MKASTTDFRIQRDALPPEKGARSIYMRFYAPETCGRILGLISVFLIWQIASMISPKDTLPAPYTVFHDALFNVILSDDFLIHVGSTLLRIVIGFGIAFIIGTGVGVLMGISKYWEKFFSDYVTIGITIPSLAWAVIGVLWLGIHYLTPVFSAVMIATPYVAVNVWEGVKNVNKDLVDMGRAFSVNRAGIIWNIHIPSILPFIFSAVRLGFSVSWKLVVVAEVFGSSEGIGYMIFYWFHNFDTSLVLAWVLVFCVVMFIYEYGVVRIIERRLFAWRKQGIL